MKTSNNQGWFASFEDEEVQKVLAETRKSQSLKGP